MRFAALGWWGVLYPELTLTPDTYAIVGEEKAGGEAVQKAEEVVKWDFSSDIYKKLLEAEAGQIQFKSRLLLGRAAFPAKTVHERQR